MNLKLTLLLLFGVLSCHSARAFSDEFRVFPSLKWKGDIQSFYSDGDWLISDHQQIYDDFGIYSLNSRSDSSLELALRTKLNMNTSSVNYLTVGWYADSSRIDGLFLEIGGSKDRIELFYKTGSTSRSIVKSADKITERSDLEIHLIITPQKSTLRISSPDFAEAELDIPEYISPKNLPVLDLHIHQSTAGFIGKHAIDYIYSGPVLHDTIAPELADVNLVDLNQIHLTFSEPILSSLIHIEVSAGKETLSVSIDSTAPGIIAVKGDFVSNLSLSISISSACDLQSNCTDTQFVFTPLFHQPPEYGDIVISEFLVDPSPPVYLPETEFIELYNRSDKVFLLSKLYFADDKDTISLPHHFLLPGSYMVFTRDTSSLRTSHKLEVDLPSLNNDHELLQVLDSNFSVIHRLEYDHTWYDDEEKSQGGWTLEMITPELFCNQGDNYRSSISPNGGTPGYQNSVTEIRSDFSPPHFVGIGAGSDSKQWGIHFDEFLSKSEIPVVSSTSDIGVKNVLSNWSSLEIELVSPPVSGSIYQISVDKISDCYGNDTSLRISFGIPDTPEPGDVIINEVLFQADRSAEFVELKNISNKLLDASLLNIQLKKDVNETWEAPAAITPNSLLFFPGQILCVTKDKTSLIRHFGPFCDPERIIESSSFPNLPSDRGSISFSLRSLAKLDSMTYSSDLHYPYLSSSYDVSLEKFGNLWLSGSSSKRFGSPGKENTRQYGPNEHPETLKISSDPFSPNNDGLHDILTIEFTTTKPCSYNMTVANMSGRPIRDLVKDGYTSTVAREIWDGLDSQGRLVPSGIYVIHLQTWGDGIPTRVERKLVTLKSGLP